MKKDTFLGLTALGWYILSAVLILAGTLIFLACTENSRARMYGGTVNIVLPKGQKLMEVTWKENNLWYLTEPMDSIYRPKTKVFREDSRFGMMEGTVIFIESR